MQQANSEPQHSDIESVDCDANSNTSYGEIPMTKRYRSFKQLRRAGSKRDL